MKNANQINKNFIEYAKKKTNQTIKDEIKNDEKRVKNENKKVKKKIVAVRRSTLKTLKEFRKSKKILIKNNEIKNSEDEKNTIKIVEKFKRSISEIDFEFTFYILKKMSVKEDKRSRNQKNSISTSDCELKFKILNEILTIIANSITNIFHDFNDYIKNEEKNFKNHKRKTITKDIAVKNFKIIKNVFKKKKLNDDELIKLNYCFMLKKIK